MLTCAFTPPHRQRAETEGVIPQMLYGLSKTWAPYVKELVGMGQQCVRNCSHRFLMNDNCILPGKVSQIVEFLAIDAPLCVINSEAIIQGTISI